VSSSPALDEAGHVVGDRQLPTSPLCPGTSAVASRKRVTTLRLPGCRPCSDGPQLTSPHRLADSTAAAPVGPV